MNDTEYRFATYCFSRITGLSEGKRHVRMPRRLVVLLQMLLDANGDAVDAEALQNAYSRTPKEPHAAKLSLSQNIFWLRRYLKDGEGSIVQTVLKRGYRIGVPIIRADEVATDTQSAASLSGMLGAAHASSSAPAADEVSCDASETSILKPANENASLLPPADMAPDHVVTKSITGAFRLADHAARAIGLLGALADGKAATPSDLAMLGWLKGVALGEMEAGMALIDRALDVAPKLPAAHFHKAWLLMAARRMDPALSQLEQGLASEGRNDSLLFLKGWALCALGYHEEQEALTLRALGFHPNHLMLRLLRSIGLALQGEPKKAEGLMVQTTMLFPQSTLLVANLAWLRAIQGDGQTALRLLTGRQKLATGYMPPVSIAAVYNVLGDETSASAYLGFAKVDQDPWRQLAWCDPRFTLLGGSGRRSLLTI